MGGLWRIRRNVLAMKPPPFRSSLCSALVHCLCFSSLIPLARYISSCVFFHRTLPRPQRLFSVSHAKLIHEQGSTFSTTSCTVITEIERLCVRAKKLTTAATVLRQVWVCFPGSPSWSAPLHLPGPVSLTLFSSELPGVSCFAGALLVELSNTHTGPRAVGPRSARRSCA